MQRAERREGGEAAAAAASYRVLSRLLGYGARPEPGGSGSTKGPAEEGAAAAGAGGALRGPQLLVFRGGGRPSDEAGAAAAGRGDPGGAELLCPRHRCALEPGAGHGPGAGEAPPRWAGLELQLAALELQPGGKKSPCPGPCPCLLPAPAAEETSDALLVLEALEPDEAGSCSEDDPASPARAPAEPQPPAPVPGGRPASRLLPGMGAGVGPRRGSLKIRLSRLFRTKSCSDPAAAAAADRRCSGELPASAGSLTDVSSARGREQDAGRKPRLTRTQSAFSPAAFSPLFTGETVSLVDVDISQRGLTSPHPPTPPPPPRRSLSLLDAFPRIVPLRPTEAVPSQPSQHLQCPLYRPDSSSFAASLRELEKCGWYWGPMNWEDAEMKLKGKPDGSFLVRDSSDPRYILSLSFRSQGITHHTRMEHYRGTFSLWCHPKFEDRCQSVVEFIKRAIMHSKNGKFLYFLRSRVPGLPPTPVQLLYPVSRFSNVKSLQHLCRFRIRQLVRIDHIPELPLPKPLISYIRKFYYYDPQEEVYLSLKEAQLISKQKQETESST
ncbi:suppressor of cytokine signaling 7 isoform X2 [Alligator mississippiensis]|uniref:suppressor of cytokine signaling 7 isoform X2 n=1 Tax=Alligator mississippiensis TaxID=8496 RepID=UPI0028776926|nr:suppressor of cytokine signaling 7 isoform X2 [Alligator mississippiensis]